jgi:hypothetical protein
VRQFLVFLALATAATWALVAAQEVVKPKSDSPTAAMTSKAKPIRRDLYFELDAAGARLDFMVSETERQRIVYRGLMLQGCEAAGIEAAKCSRELLQPVAPEVKK